MEIEALLCPNPLCAEVAIAPAESYCGQCGHAIALDGKYRLVRLLGEGGMGRTYLAQDLRFLGTPNERCVVKELKSELEDDPKAGVLLRREAGRLLDLRHPSVPSYRDFLSLSYNERKYLFMVQQHIEGDDLQVLIDRDGPMPLADVLPMMRDALDILHVMHSQRDAETGALAPLLHLDFKPQNLMLRHADKRLFLIDFGISAQIEMAMFQTHGAKISKGGFSPGFSPFEQTMGYVAPASDIFSWAMTFMVVLTGRQPTELLDPLSGTAMYNNYVSLPSPLDEILGACLSTHMKDRPQSVQALQALLDADETDKTLPSVAAPSFSDLLPEGSAPAKEPLPTASSREGWLANLVLDGTETSERILSVRHLQRQGEGRKGGFVAPDPSEKPTPDTPAKSRGSWQIIVLLLFLGLGVGGGVWVAKGGLSAHFPADARSTPRRPLTPMGLPTRRSVAKEPSRATAGALAPRASGATQARKVQQKRAVPKKRSRAPARPRQRPRRRQPERFGPLPYPKHAGRQYGGGSVSASSMGYRPQRSARLAYHAKLRQMPLLQRPCVDSSLLKDLAHTDAIVQRSVLRWFRSLRKRKKCQHRRKRIAKFLAYRLIREKKSGVAAMFAQVLGEYRCDARSVLLVMRDVYSAHREALVKRAIRRAYRRIQACATKHYR